jgi:hypothetical protein
MGYSEMGARSGVGSISGLGGMRGTERKNLHALWTAFHELHHRALNSASPGGWAPRIWKRVTKDCDNLHLTDFIEIP